MLSGEQIDLLKRRHMELEVAIAEEEQRPKPDDLAIAGWKREKLRIKDMLAMSDED